MFRKQWVSIVKSASYIVLSKVDWFFSCDKICVALFPYSVEHQSYYAIAELMNHITTRNDKEGNQLEPVLRLIGLLQKASLQTGEVIYHMRVLSKRL